MIKKIYNIAVREVGIMSHNPIYIFCMIIFPFLVVIFFMSLMDEGEPLEMPVGVIDLDNTYTTRTMVRELDAFNTTKITKDYANVNEARRAIQRNEIYAFIYFPAHTTDDLLASRQPKISFYYNDACITGGSLLFRDLKTISTLGSAAVGSAKLSALGKTGNEIKAFLQPITIDLHPLNNPEVNYNYYLSTSLPPACLMLFVFLITAYSIGTELKFNRAKEWMQMSDNNIVIALIGKLLPQFLVFFAVFLLYFFYSFYVKDFPHQGGIDKILLLAFLAVVSGQGFGTFAFGLMPSLRMSMSIGSLWASLSFSVMGSTFPITAMQAPIETLAELFPMRHYFMIYQACVFNGYSIWDVWWNIAALILFTALPILVLGRIKKALLEWIYIP